MGLGAFVLGGSFVCRWRSVGFLVSSVLELLREGKEGDGKKVLDFRYELEDRLAAELLEPEGLGLLLGGAIGTGTCYIDLLLFDELAFMEKIVPFLKDYPQYHFYLSDFRQGSDLCRLYETEDDESEE